MAITKPSSADRIEVFTRASMTLALSVAVGVLLVPPLSTARAQQRTWLRQFGTFSYDLASAVAPSEEGGGFVAGETGGSLYGPLLSLPDVFLARFDDGGNHVWGVQFGTSSFERVHALGVASKGGVFVAGVTKGNLGGQNAGSDDAWLARYDSSGRRMWARQLGSPAADAALTLASDGSTGVFVAGSTLGALVVPPPVGPAYGWIARYDGAGDQVWLRQYQSGKQPVGGAIVAMAPDGAGGLFAASGTYGVFDVWVGRFDAGGDVVWAREFGTSEDEAPWALCPDGFGGFFVAGLTLGSLGGPNAGEFDVWVAHYDGTGNRLALSQFGTSASDFVEGLAADGLGGAFLGGSANGPLGGPHAGLADAWIARTQSGASLTWIRQLGTPYFDAAAALAPAGRGGAFIAGVTHGNLTGSGGGGPHNGDAWIARYETCYPDCNADGALTVADFGCFQTRFITADLYADCNADGVLTVADFGCFQTRFVVGCP